MDKRIQDLAVITSPADTDLIAIDALTGGTTRAMSVEKVKEYVLDGQEVGGTDPGDIIDNGAIQTLTHKTLTSPKINEDVTVTATATELNTMDGITASTAELNKLDGATASTAELNYVTGVTSDIQTQLDGKASTEDYVRVYKDDVTASSSTWTITSTEIMTQLGWTDCEVNYHLTIEVGHKLGVNNWEVKKVVDMNTKTSYSTLVLNDIEITTVSGDEYWVAITVEKKYTAA